MIAGVWFRGQRDKDFRRIGREFRGYRVVGQYGWVELDDGALCVNPAERHCLIHRTTDGRFHYRSLGDWSKYDSSENK